MIDKKREVKLSNEAMTILPEKMFPVEIPYKLELTLSAVPNINISTKEKNNLFTEEVSAYVQKRTEYINNSTVEVSATASQRTGEPFIYLLPSNLIDGNFGVRSGWIGDSIPAVITINLGKPQSIQGVYFSSEKGPRVPSSYHIEYSIDGVTWIKVIDRKDNIESERIDLFDRPVDTKYVRFTIDTTTSGAFAYLDEFEVIPQSGVSVAQKYQNPKELVSRLTRAPNSLYAYIKIRWQTDRTYTDTPPQEFIVPIRADGLVKQYSFRIPEMENFSRNGEFLKKYITHIAIDPLGPYNIQIHSGTIKPYYEITNTK